MRLDELEESLKQLHSVELPATAQERILGSARQELSRTWVDRLTSSPKLWAALAGSIVLLVALGYVEEYRHGRVMQEFVPTTEQMTTLEIPEVAELPKLEHLLNKEVAKADPGLQLARYCRYVQSLLEGDFSGSSDFNRKNG